ncbi:MAG: uracil-DNA glycosylase [Gammaproteobacteria bacterium]|nr:uracil-DNA glycosylase [Gammaproteobacteria bacterium]
MVDRQIKLHSSWLGKLQSEFEQAYMQKLSVFLRNEKASGQIVYPRGEDIFNALNSTPLEQVRVVILGQDPYHGPGQAHGLSFSVPIGERVPPSLKNIYKELHADVGFEVPSHGNLQAWAERGILLLNSVLTVRQSSAGSHQGQGWEKFTDKIIDLINSNADNVVFLLWGSYAQKKGQAIDRSRHLVLQAPHPSPLSAHRGFLGCRHFSQTNDYLASLDLTPIDWQLY